jgi:hypothetical protein
MKHLSKLVALWLIVAGSALAGPQDNQAFITTFELVSAGLADWPRTS